MACTGACTTGACNCGLFGQNNVLYYPQSSGGQYVVGAAGYSTSGMTADQKLDAILNYVTQIAQRMQQLEDMLVDTNAGIDELLAERTFNSDEKVCRHSEEGCESSDSTGDTPDPAEPSSSGQDEC